MRCFEKLVAKVDKMKQQKSIVKKPASKKQAAKKRELKAPPHVKTEIAMLALVTAYMSMHVLQLRIEKPQEAYGFAQQVERLQTMINAGNVSDEEVIPEVEKFRPLMRKVWLEAVNNAAYQLAYLTFQKSFGDKLSTHEKRIAAIYSLIHVAKDSPQVKSLVREAAKIHGRSAEWSIVWEIAYQHPELKSRIDDAIAANRVGDFKERTEKIANNFYNSRKVESNNILKRAKAIANAFFAIGYGSFAELEIGVSSPKIEEKNGIDAPIPYNILSALPPIFFTKGKRSK